MQVNVACRWFLELSLIDKVPYTSTLSANRTCSSRFLIKSYTKQ
ncbi:hypothetical protein [Marinomonas sp. GJ51-6]